MDIKVVVISRNRITLIGYTKKSKKLFDNPIHKSESIKQMIYDMGHRIKILPPYSPDFNPIENMFSKWMNYIRKKIPNNADLNKIINEVLIAVTEDCSGKKLFDEIGIPPKVMLTRWGTWVKAA